MPRNPMTKQEMEMKVLKLKNELHDGSWTARNTDWHEGGNHMLDKVLDILQEYRY
jgi:hypothetical protein